MELLREFDDDGLLAELAEIRVASGIAARPEKPGPAAANVTNIDFSSDQSHQYLELDPDLEARMARARAEAAQAESAKSQTASKGGDAAAAERASETRSALSRVVRALAAQRASLQDAVEEAAAAVGARERGVGEDTIQRRAKAHLTRLSAAAAGAAAIDKEFSAIRRAVEEMISTYVGDS